MSSYRFCRTDDVSLLVDALNRCWSPHFPDQPAVTPETFKRSIRDLQVWCSSCMVAFAGPDPIAVLIGAKRQSATLIHKIAVHPDHRRQGHGRHLLTSLSSKLAILGPPKMVAETPENFDATRALFKGSGYVEEAILTDYVLERLVTQVEGVDGLVIPLSVDDFIANGLADPKVCWERSVETLMARKDEVEGLAVASDERIEAFVLYVKGGEILSMRSFIEDDGARLRELLARVRAGGIPTLRFPKVHPAEISTGLLEALGFQAAARYQLYAAQARSH
jgi:GNAT superfamily N-acetyltransferase